MLALATRLRGLDDEALLGVLRVRNVPAAGIRDFFDLAETLLDSVNVQQALAHLDRPTLAVLAVSGDLTSAASRNAGEGGPSAAELTARLDTLRRTPLAAPSVADSVGLLHTLALGELVGDAFSPYDAVIALLRDWPQHGLPGGNELITDTAPVSAAQATPASVDFTDRLAAERAFAAVSSIAELVTAVAREPARELSRGGLGLPDSKRLAAVMSVELDSVAALVLIAARAGLIARSEGHWMETETGEAWLLSSTTHRWLALAESWSDALPPDVAHSVPHEPGVSWGEGLHDLVAWLYPAGGPVMHDRVTEFARDAEILGITAQQATGTVGAALLAGNRDRAIEAMTAALPAEVGAVYLQHDLSIVSPGPLAASIDARLRGMAEVESRELASSFRITAASVNRALAAGENADSILGFLRGISLTGIPQPVDYLITESAGRYGRVRTGSVTAADAPARSYVRSADEALLGTILVDQTLASLGLERRGDRLVSTFPTDTVFWALSDARYPVAAEDDTAEIVHLRRHPLAAVAPAATVDPAETLLQVLRTTDGGEVMAADAWLARQLDSAIKAKQTVTVSISMPGGVVVDYLLEPASVSGGRFRARDRRADIERTLPLSSIISITPVP
ncbi:MAG: helicase-associated domain-containing protein [Cryobacterium sp.]